MALIAGIPHTADVFALRDSEIFAVPKQAFFEACDADASVMTELARLMILRSRQTARRGPVGEPSVFGFLPVGRPGPIRPIVERLAYEIAGLGYEVTTVGSEADDAPTEWFSEVERVHDFVLYVAERDEPGWVSTARKAWGRAITLGRPVPTGADRSAPQPSRTSRQD